MATILHERYAALISLKQINCHFSYTLCMHWSQQENFNADQREYKKNSHTLTILLFRLCVIEQTNTHIQSTWTKCNNAQSSPANKYYNVNEMNCRLVLSFLCVRERDLNTSKRDLQRLVFLRTIHIFIWQLHWWYYSVDMTTVWQMSKYSTCPNSCLPDKIKIFLWCKGV